MRGKLLAIVGINGVGKTTQIALLIAKLIEAGFKVCSQKYPIYKLEPTGPKINAYLRENNPENLSAEDFQILCAQNRRDFEPQLKKLLEEYDFVIAEMYTESGILFGMCDGVSREVLEKMNEDLFKPHSVILLSGDPFMKENQHHFEQNQEKLTKAKQYHLDFAHEFNWTVINANQRVEQVLQELFDRIFLIAESERV